ncbi:MAG: ROK family protein [Christensenellaceae bacterium]|jgi:predicted NBD/HSP70 family sugar kinase|nr:ROK family protein [Christensenellaceae bacterium]
MTIGKFEPAYTFYKNFNDIKAPKKLLRIAVRRGDGEVETANLQILDGNLDFNIKYIERYVKTMLWCYGGYAVYLDGDDQITKILSKIYSANGKRAFDYDLMKSVYIKDGLDFYTVTNPDEFPISCNKAKTISKNLGGRRIGFDAGGSDRKVTACVDGKVVFERETIWHPKTRSDIGYHIAGVRDDIDAAIFKLGGSFDSIGVSTAGIVIDGELRRSSLLRMVPGSDIIEKGFGLFKDLETVYHKPIKVANDGDAAALAGAFETGSGRMIGASMGTSFAGGYVDRDMRILGYLNEFAFIPVDMSNDAPIDEWSGDRGCGVSYHSQDAAIRLALEVDIDLTAGKTPAEKLNIIKDLAERGDNRALDVYDTMGEYFGYTALWLQQFYDIDKIMYLGRVSSGRGGQIILSKANQILKMEKSLAQIISPSETQKRLGQSYAAALL